jgi:hypothetical protein
VRESKERTQIIKERSKGNERQALDERNEMKDIEAFWKRNWWKREQVKHVLFD